MCSKSKRHRDIQSKASAGDVLCTTLVITVPDAVRCGLQVLRQMLSGRLRHSRRALPHLPSGRVASRPRLAGRPLLQRLLPRLPLSMLRQSSLALRTELIHRVARLLSMTEGASLTLFQQSGSFFCRMLRDDDELYLSHWHVLNGSSIQVL